MQTFLFLSRVSSWMQPFLLRLPLVFFLAVEFQLLWMHLLLQCFPLTFILALEEFWLLGMQPLLLHLLLVLLMAVEE